MWGYKEIINKLSSMYCQDMNFYCKLIILKYRGFLSKQSQMRPSPVLEIETKDAK
ncbi:unnamed protein product [Moneuplotes crassus]|uniref:Uncharacterized protein n=1 Tax=Euplotes crassus TaxID=5936 RepID=A0AAD1XRK1_EUPCR|nr:unnamed protein product [Moneuplotes crassus]